VPKLSWYSVLDKKIPSFLLKNIKKQKSPSAKGQRAGYYLALRVDI